MSFSTVVKSKIFTLSSGLMISLCPLVDAGTLPKPLGPLQQISPNPATSPDPILENLITVADNWFQRPLYQGLNPFPTNYLGAVTVQAFTYGWRSGNGILFNPINDRNAIAFIRQNGGRDRTATYLSGFMGTYVTARSTDGGLSWIFGPPVNEPIPLGGTVSQVVFNIQSVKYAKNGRLYAFSEFFDLQTNPPETQPIQRLVLNISDDNGRTWTPPQTIVKNPEETVLNEIFFNACIGTVVSAPTLTVSPWDSDHLFFSYATALAPDFLYGDCRYKISRNSGLTVSEEKKLYNMIDDPVWVKEHFDPDFTSDPTYLLSGGQCFAEAPGIVPVDENVLIFPLCRFYPKIGSTTYLQEVSDSNNDIGIARSLNNGKTWLAVAGAVEQYVFPLTHTPAGQNPVTGSRIVVANGATNISVAVSPYTGRIYMTYLAANPAADPDPEKYRFFSYILLSVSSDQGATWSKPIQINLTPTNIPFDNQQAFYSRMVMTQDGSVVVSYYDFRNYTGGNDPNSFCETDAWLAIYKEVDHAHGGSTGLGLDVVGEVRLTPSSFNFRTTFLNSLAGAFLSVNNQNQLYATFVMTNENNPAKITPGYRNITIDTNNRLNVFLQRFQFPKPSNQ